MRRDEKLETLDEPQTTWPRCNGRTNELAAAGCRAAAISPSWPSPDGARRALGASFGVSAPPVN
jgi:hypothetical protein